MLELERFRCVFCMLLFGGLFLKPESSWYLRVSYNELVDPAAYSPQFIVKAVQVRHALGPHLNSTFNA